VIHFNDRIRDLAGILNMDRLRLAEYLGINGCTVGQWMGYESDTTVSYLWRVALRTGYTADVLVGPAWLGAPTRTAVWFGRTVLAKETGLTAFGRVLDHERRRRCESQRGLARQFGLASSSLHGWLRETSEPNLSNAVAVASGLGVSLDDMLSGAQLAERGAA
jgi:transcriptional regulator with XRE-family HTH domain